jgi:hypothetical protein
LRWEDGFLQEKPSSHLNSHLITPLLSCLAAQGQDTSVFPFGSIVFFPVFRRAPISPAAISPRLHLGCRHFGRAAISAAPPFPHAAYSAPSFKPPPNRGRHLVAPPIGVAPTALHCTALHCTALPYTTLQDGRQGEQQIQDPVRPEGHG